MFAGAWLPPPCCGCLRPARPLARSPRSPPLPAASSLALLVRRGCTLVVASCAVPSHRPSCCSVPPPPTGFLRPRHPPPLTRFAPFWIMPRLVPGAAPFCRSHAGARSWRFYGRSDAFAVPTPLPHARDPSPTPPRPPFSSAGLRALSRCGCLSPRRASANHFASGAPFLLVDPLGPGPRPSSPARALSVNSRGWLQGGGPDARCRLCAGPVRGCSLPLAAGQFRSRPPAISPRTVGGRFALPTPPPRLLRLLTGGGVPVAPRSGAPMIPSPNNNVRDNEKRGLVAKFFVDRDPLARRTFTRAFGRTMEMGTRLRAMPFLTVLGRQLWRFFDGSDAGSP